jgi:hypothetical protein
MGPLYTGPLGTPWTLYLMISRPTKTYSPGTPDIDL